jgi:uncharacterized RDD family membrane protein YckC
MSLLKRLAEAEANASSTAPEQELVPSVVLEPSAPNAPASDSAKPAGASGQSGLEAVNPADVSGIVAEAGVAPELRAPGPPEVIAPRPTVTSLAAPVDVVVNNAASTGMSSGTGTVPASAPKPIGHEIRIDPEDPANVQRSKEVANWWLPEDVHSWWEIPEPEMGEPTKDKPLTVEELMRREREFHLFGRGVGGKHVPDHSARLLAFIVDVAVHAAVGFLGYRGMLSAYPDRFTRYQVIAVVAGGTWLLLTLIPLLLWRATPGKLLLGLRVVRVNGDEVSAVRAAMRGVLPLLVPLLPLDFLTILSSPHRRRLGDYLFGTRVVSNG